LSPLKWASKVDSLQKLVEARNQLSALKTYMDGKSQAEELLNKIIDDPNLLKAIADAPKPEDKAE